MPILYFGNSVNFAASTVRVVTAALNPSRIEFISGEAGNDTWSRFQNADAANLETYFNTLDDYFNRDPYEWFRNFENLLTGMNLSYHRTEFGSALHTDMGSPLATDPTWNDLPRATKLRLKSDGLRLWHDLLNVLSPDIVVISVARTWLMEVLFEPVSDPQVVFNVSLKKDGTPRKNAFLAEAQWYRSSSKKKFMIAFVPASQKPMGSISVAQQQAVGLSILNSWLNEAHPN